MNPSSRYEHVLGFAVAHPWAVDPPMLSVIAGILARRMVGEEIPRSEIEAAVVNRQNLPQPRAGSVAVIPVYGVIAPRMNLFSEMSGGTSYDKLGRDIRDAVNSREVRTIILDINSPGGSVAGSAELAAELMRARTKKPIIAQGQFQMASAAYHLAAATTEIVAAPSAQVGSIGTYSILNDISAALDQMGVKRTFLFAGIGKDANNEAAAPSADLLARTQTAVDEAYASFVANVVAGRGKGVTEAKVRREWQAHVYSGPEALRLGMIDRVGTLDETIARLLEESPNRDDQRLAASYRSGDDTAQTPSAAVAQDRLPDLLLERQLFETLLTDTLGVTP